MVKIIIFSTVHSEGKPVYYMESQVFTSKHSHEKYGTLWEGIGMALKGAVFSVKVCCWLRDQKSVT